MSAMSLHKNPKSIINYLQKMDTHNLLASLSNTAKKKNKIQYCFQHIVLIPYNTVNFIRCSLPVVFGNGSGRSQQSHSVRVGHSSNIELTYQLPCSD